jgi:hypothetical protein
MPKSITAGLSQAMKPQDTKVTIGIIQKLMTSQNVSILIAQNMTDQRLQAAFRNGNIATIRDPAVHKIEMQMAAQNKFSITITVRVDDMMMASIADLTDIRNITVVVITDNSRKMVKKSTV